MITEKMKETIEGFMKKFPCKDSAIIPSLGLVQKENGYVSERDMEELSVILKFPEARIFSAASFYSMLKLRPEGKYHIQVCANVVCSLTEEGPLYDHISGRLGIEKGDITPDGLFSIEPVECLGSCGYAPAMMINSDHYENMSFEKVDEIIESIRKEELNT